MVLKHHRDAGPAGGPVTSRHAPTTRWGRASALGALSCAVAAAGMLLPADAAVRDPHTVLILKNESIVEVEGLVPGENVRVQVRRNGVVVGSVEGPASAPGGTFAINHDFCWDDFTPQILAGDVVQVTTASGTDTARVSDIEVLAPPTVTAGVGTIRGHVNGTPPPVDQLEVFLRSEDPNRFRPVAPGTFDRGPEENTVTGTIAYDGGGDFTATFTGMTAEQEQQFASPAEFHVAHIAATGAGGDPKEMTIATEGEPVPGPGCAVDAPNVDAAVTAMTPSVVNRRNAGATMRVQGFSQAAQTVTVRLRDGDGTVVSQQLTPAGTAAQTWAAAFDALATRGLSGRVTATAVVDGVAAPVRKGMLKDLTAPGEPRPSVRGGTYRRTQFVSLNTGAANRIRYTLGNGTQARPTTTHGVWYGGTQLRIARSKVLKMVAIDRAGNVSPLRRVGYVIRSR